MTRTISFLLLVLTISLVMAGIHLFLFNWLIAPSFGLKTLDYLEGLKIWCYIEIMFVIFKTAYLAAVR